MSRLALLVTALFLAQDTVLAFTTPTRTGFGRLPLLSLAALDPSLEEQAKEKGITEPGRNPDRPELPELKGDFDWDEKFGGDEEEWTTKNVPGRIVLGDVELATQVTALTKLENQWRKERMFEEYEAERKLGWTQQAETYNGRFAMFFLVTGLLTELWTGFTIPGQVEELLRVAGVIGQD